MTPTSNHYERSSPGDDLLRLRRRQAASSADKSSESARSGSPLYMKNSRYSNTGAPATPANSPKLQLRLTRRARGSRQSLSAISNQSSAQFTTPSQQNPDHSTSPLRLSSPVRLASRSLSPTPPLNDEHAWRIINREIKEWQKVCHTGQPHWWHPTSRWTRRMPSTTEQHILPFGPEEWVEWVDEPEEKYYPGLCFEYAKRLAESSKEEDNSSALQELALIIAVQLLSASFTLPVDQFLSSTATANIFYAPADEENMPYPYMISSLRMHTNYRWSPAFGYEQRTTSPESNGPNPYECHPENSGIPQGQTPEVGDSSWAPRKRRVHRIRNVTPANTVDFEGWEDEKVRSLSDQGDSATTPRPGQMDLLPIGRQSSMPVLPSRRVVQSAPVTPNRLRQMRSMEIPMYRSRREPRNEFPFPVTEEDDRPSTSRYLLQPHLRSEPHPVFVQPVKELVVKPWRTFRRRFGHSLSHGNPEQDPTPSVTLPNENWPRSPPASTRAVKRRRDARSRHDIHSSSMESSPRFNTPTSGTPSGASTPACEAPENTPTGPEGTVDDLLAAARAITNSSLATPLPDPQTSSQPFPVFTPNNTPSSNADSERSPTLLPRNDAGFFVGPPNAGRPQFVSRRRSANRRSLSRRSMLSEVYPPEDQAKDKAKEINDSFSARRHLQEAGGSILTTPTEESEGSDGSMVHKDNRRRLIGTDNDRPRELSKLGDGYQRQKEASQTGGSPAMRTQYSEPLSSPSTFVIDDNPFSFLVPKSEHPANRSRSASMGMHNVSHYDSRRSSRVSDRSHDNDSYDPHAADCMTSKKKDKRKETNTVIRQQPLFRPQALVELQTETEPVLLPPRSPEARRPRRTYSTPVDLRGEDFRDGDFDEGLRIALGRDRLQRVSTQGTTVFTPSEHGVEVDGLPVGPGVEMWDEVVGGLRRSFSLMEDGIRRGRRRARSFL